MSHREPIICIVSSGGGHLTEVRLLKPAYEKYRHFYVLNYPIILPDDMEGRTHWIRHSERDWLFVANVLEAWRILRCERPAVILSTGAGPIVPFALVAKLLRISTIYVETVGRVREPSVTGRVMHRLADRFFYQWPSLAPHFPRGIHGGSLL